MTNYKVVFEIEIDSDSPLAAAKIVQNWLEGGTNWQFYVSDSKKVFSVDLAEEDEDAVLEIDKYVPMIK